MDDEILKTLELCPLFRGMTADHIEQLLNEISYKIVHFEKKDIYALAGYPCKYADIILLISLTFGEAVILQGITLICGATF